MPEPQEHQIQLRFPYIEGRVPVYSNVVLVNPLPEGVMIDFGFFDPFLIKELQEKGLLKEDGAEGMVVHPLQRFVLDEHAAKQLSSQLQAYLTSKQQDRDE